MRQSTSTWGTRASVLLVRKDKKKLVAMSTLKIKGKWKNGDVRENPWSLTQRVCSGFSTLCCSTWRSSGNSATCCATTLRSGSGATSCDSTSASGCSSFVDEQGMTGEMKLETQTLHQLQDEAVSAALVLMMHQGKEAVIEEVEGWTKEQLTGRKWNGLVARWTFLIHHMVGSIPRCHLGGCDSFNDEKKWIGVASELVMEGIFNMVKEVTYFVKTGCLDVAESTEKCEALGDGLHEAAEGAAEVETELGSDNKVVCDQQMHAQLRGGMMAQGEQDDWKTVGRSKGGIKKSFYGHKPLNLKAVQSSTCESRTGKAHAGFAALGSVEDTSWDSNDSVESDSGNELRGGAGGSATTQRKKQVSEAVTKMEDILNGLLHTQKDNNEADEVESVLTDFRKIVESWDANKPTKADLKSQLEVMLGKLKSNMAAGSSEQHAPQTSRRQSFYTEFHKKAQEQLDERLNEKSAKQKANKGKGKGKGKGKSKDKSDFNSLPKYDLRQAFPMMSISSWITVHRDIEDGKDPIGTAAICPDLATISEIQALSEAHSLTKEVLLIMKPDSKEVAEVQVKGVKKALLPYQGNLALVEAIIATSTGNEPTFGGTTPVKAVAINRSLKKENNVSLRVMVVKGILTNPDLEKMKSDPTFALHLLECNKELEELKTAGWTEQSEAFVGYLEIDKDKAETILKLSGQGGVFISHLRKNVVEWPNVSWRLPEKDEGMKEYHARIWHHAKELDKPMAYRRGGGAALGIVMPESQDDNTVHSWTMSGIPASWGPVSVREWLEKQGWSVMDCSQPRRRDRPWSFRGRNSDRFGTRAFAYEIQVENEKSVYVHITRWEKRRKADAEVTPLASSKLWWSKNATYDDDPIEDDDTKEDELSITKTWPDKASATLIDSTAGEENKQEEDDAMTGKVKGAPVGNSPPKKRSKQEKKPDIDRVYTGAAGPEAKGVATMVVDTGGQGDCGWRALSYAIMGINSPSMSEEQLMGRLDTLAKAMQAKVTTYLINHKQLWETSWAPDPKSNTVMEAGPVPTSIAEYCEAIRRPQRWMDGMLLASTAVLQKVNIIIWTKKNGAWKRLAVLKSGDDWAKSHTVPLILSRGHYVTLRHRKGGWPKDWILEAEDELPCSQGIDSQYTDLNQVLGRAGMMNTPVDKIKKRSRISPHEDDEVDGFLRTCSTRTSGRKSRRTHDPALEDEMDIDHLLRSCACSSKATAQKLQGKKEPEVEDEIDIDFLLRSCASREEDPRDGQAAEGKQKKKKWVKAPNKRIAVNGNKKEWTCPICQEVLNIAKGDTIDRKAVQKHVQGRHYDVWKSNKVENAKHGKIRSDLGLRQLTWPVQFKKIAKEDIPQQAQFICPYCELCLPKIQESNYGKKQYIATLSKTHHLKSCANAPEGACYKLLQKDFAEKFPDKSRMAYARRPNGKKQEEKPRKRIRVPSTRIVTNAGRKEWKCPLCSEVLDVDKDGKVDRRAITRHIQDVHHEEWVNNRAENAKFGKAKSNLGLRELTWPTPFVQMKNEEVKTEAICVCPYCELCLPKPDAELNFYKKKYLVTLSKKHHIKVCKKAPEDINLQMFQRDFAVKFSGKTCEALRAQHGMQWSEDKIEKMKQRGHLPIVVDFNNWSSKKLYGDRFLLCVKCRSILKLTHRSRLNCKGSCCQGLSPGLNFWAEAEKRNRLAEMVQKLQLDKDEVGKVNKALLDLKKDHC